MEACCLSVRWSRSLHFENIKETAFIYDTHMDIYGFIASKIRGILLLICHEVFLRQHGFVTKLLTCMYTQAKFEEVYIGVIGWLICPCGANYFHSFWHICNETMLAWSTSNVGMCDMSLKKSDFIAECWTLEYTGVCVVFYHFHWWLLVFFSSSIFITFCLFCEHVKIKVSIGESKMFLHKSLVFWVRYS